MAVARTESMLDVIGGSLNPSGACRIYAKAITVHTIAGANAIR